MDTPLPLNAQQMHLMLQASRLAASDLQPEALFRLIEALVADLTGVTTVRALLVSTWHGKLFQYTQAPSDSSAEAEGSGFVQTAVFDIGEDAAGLAAASGEVVYIDDCQRHGGCSQESGSLLCWPLLNPNVDADGAFPGGIPPAAAAENSEGAIAGDGGDTGSPNGAGAGAAAAVLAVLELHKADGPLGAAAAELLGYACGILAGWVLRALSAYEDEVRCRTAEALLCVSQIAPKGLDLVDMLDEVVNAAYYFTQAERVCLFFVDEVMNELWAAKSTDLFEGVKIPLGKGICGYAAATGEVVNVADCYTDQRFDRTWDRHTGFRTRSVLCMPIPPPEYQLGPAEELPEPPPVEVAGESSGDSFEDLPLPPPPPPSETSESGTLTPASAAFSDEGVAAAATAAAAALPAGTWAGGGSGGGGSGGSGGGGSGGGGGSSDVSNGGGGSSGGLIGNRGDMSGGSNSFSAALASTGASNSGHGSCHGSGHGSSHSSPAIGGGGSSGPVRTSAGRTAQRTPRPWSNGGPAMGASRRTASFNSGVLFRQFSEEGMGAAAAAAAVAAAAAGGSVTLRHASGSPERTMTLSPTRDGSGRGTPAVLQSRSFDLRGGGSGSSHGGNGSSHGGGNGGATQTPSPLSTAAVPAGGPVAAAAASAAAATTAAAARARNRQVLERAYEASMSNVSGPQRGERGRKPMAVLEVLNKRGGGVFDEVDEDALLLFCAEVESLLRQKAVEATLMKRAYQERRRLEAGIPETKRSAHAKIEGAILSQYAEFNTASRFLSMFGSADGAQVVPTDAALPPPKVPAIPALAALAPTPLSAVPPAPPAPTSSSTPSTPSSGPITGAASVFPGVAAHLRAAGTPQLAAAAGGTPVAAGSLPREPGEAWAMELGGSAGLEAALMDWDLNVFVAPPEAKCSMLEAMYQSLHVCEPFKVDLLTLRRFVAAVRARYKPNPFHNFNHAFSVAHVTYMIVRSTRAGRRLLPLDVLAGLTAALCHDVDHPGNNNQFEVNSLSSLALQHSDDAVLERHHVHVTFRVLLREDGANNIFRGLTRQQFREARKIVIQTVLATDMSKHVEHCSRLSVLAHRVKARLHQAQKQQHQQQHQHQQAAAVAAAQLQRFATVATSQGVPLPLPPPMAQQSPAASHHQRRQTTAMLRPLSPLTPGQRTISCFAVPPFIAAMAPPTLEPDGTAGEGGSGGGQESAGGGGSGIGSAGVLSRRISSLGELEDAAGGSSGGQGSPAHRDDEDSGSEQEEGLSSAGAAASLTFQGRAWSSHAAPSSIASPTQEAAQLHAATGFSGAGQHGKQLGDAPPHLGHAGAATQAQRRAYKASGGRMSPRLGLKRDLGRSSSQLGDIRDDDGGAAAPSTATATAAGSGGGAAAAGAAAAGSNGAGSGSGGGGPAAAGSVGGTARRRWSNLMDEDDVFKVDRSEDRGFLLETVVHCADLSGQVMSTHLALEWGRRILQEFKNQAAIEEAAGLPVTFVRNSDEVELMKGQLFFLSKIITPLWEPFITIFPELDHILGNLDRNRRYYELEIAKLSAAEEREGAAAAAAKGGAAASAATAAVATTAAAAVAGPDAAIAAGHPPVAAADSVGDSTGIEQPPLPPSGQAPSPRRTVGSAGVLLAAAMPTPAAAAPAPALASLAPGETAAPPAAGAAGSKAPMAASAGKPSESDEVVGSPVAGRNGNVGPVSRPRPSREEIAAASGQQCSPSIAAPRPVKSLWPPVDGPEKR